MSRVNRATSFLSQPEDRIVNIRVRPAYLMLGTLLVLLGPCRLQAQSKNVRKWMDAVKAGADRKWDGKTNPADFWLERLPDFAMNALLQEQEAGATDKEMKRNIEYIVREFGRDAYIDFRLFAVCDQMMDPLQVPNFDRTEEDWATAPRKSLLLDKQIKWFAETQVEDWKRYPEKIERLVWFRVWRRSYRPDQVFLPGTYSSMAKDDPNASHRRRWQSQRLLMYLQCMTDCADLSIGKTDAQIRASHQEWSERLLSAAKDGRVRPSGYAPKWVVRPVDGRKRRPNFEWPKLRVIPRIPFPDWPKNLPVPKPESVF